MRIVFYISGHGLGHSARQIEVIRELTREPRVRIVVRTSAPRWLFDATAPPSIAFDHVEVDTGIVQIDSLRLDESATVRSAAAFYAGFDQRAQREAQLLHEIGADVVVGDIPPLASAAAGRAGLPSLAIGNFTWDWIYSIYEGFERDAPLVIPTIQRAYAQTTLALRLPFHGGFQPMRALREIPLIARRSTRDPRDTLRALGVDWSRPLVLASFSEYGVELPLDQLRRSDRFTLLAPTRYPPAGLRYEDLVAAADVVVSKPGYGIVSECVANDTALLYTSRGTFAEYDVFVAAMPAMLRCRYLPQDDLLAGRWADAVDALLAQPAPADRPPVDGAQVAARHILDAIH